MLNRGIACVLIAAFGVATTVFADPVKTTWLGGCGFFSDPGKWDNGLPAADRDVVLTNLGPDDIVTNDMENLTIQTLSFIGSGKFHLTGNGITLNYGNALHVEGGADVTIDVPLTCTTVPFNWNLAFNVTGTARFMQPVKVTSEHCLWFNTVYQTSGSCNLHFHAPLSAGGCQLSFQRGSAAVHAYAPIDVSSTLVGSGHEPHFNLHCAGNDLGAAEVAYYGWGIIADHPDAFVPGQVLRWKAVSLDGSGSDSQGSYRMRYDQTFDRMSGAAPVKSGETDMRNVFHVINDGQKENVVLTMQGTADDTTYAEIGPKISLVWDPSGDFTQTFSDRTHRLDGSIRVTRGAVRSAGSNAFPSLQALDLDGGAFEVDSTGVCLSGLTELDISGTGRFRMTSNATADPFPDGQVIATLSQGGAFELPAGRTVFLKELSVDGVYPAPGTYTGTDAGQEGVTTVDWIVGEGLVVVANAGITSWKGASTGAWTDAANWTAGVPDASARVYITAQGGDYTVTLPAEIASGELIVGSGDPAGTATVVVSSDLTMAGIKVDIRDGGVFSLTGGTFTYEPLAAGDVFRLSEGGLVSVTGGDFRFTVSDSFPSPFEQRGGRLSVTGGKFGPNAKAVQFVVGDGGADFSGTGEFTGTCTRFNAASEAGTTNVFTLSGSAAMGHLEIFYLGNGAGTAVFDWNTSAPLHSDSGIELGFGYRAYVGYDSGTGVLNVTNSSFGVGAAGIYVGGSSAYTVNPADDEVIKGCLDVLDGGTVMVEGSGASHTGWGNGMVQGINIGYGMYTRNANGRQFQGEVRVKTGGSLVGQKGDVTVGSGHGTGLLEVDGGSVSFNRLDTNSGYCWDRTFGIGILGGHGRCVVRNGGELLSKITTYVGGVGTDVFVQGVNLVNYGMLSGFRHESRGELVVEDGTLEIGKNLVLGAEGFGTVRRNGSSGSFSVGGDLICSNDVDAAVSGSEMVFVADAGGVAPINVAGRVVIGDNATLSVDMTSYAGPERSMKLLGWSSCEGDFSDVDLIGVDLKKFKLSRRTRGLYLTRIAGTVVICR